ncbi:uncharacterized protein DUF2233 [Aneurinibacillus soli]|uniref:Uncharacterized protein n=1 Tax=Aneurinibacillus soli TaxID=1500254 RepID=A0A0U5BCN1_9BACL|nr:phosphodiester glycosidase family protein [Aneurinibacillus soli]PYE63994.1 uncharacterized protein DUF2233 [Aneurinibacillus soli]BAU27943.1 hypothetical protein CB4_02117 [Aneurinibacillus soli]
MLYPNSKQLERVSKRRSFSPATLWQRALAKRWIRSMVFVTYGFVVLLMCALGWFYFTKQGTHVRGIVAEAVYTSKQTKYTWLLVGQSGVEKIKESFLRQAEENYLAKQNMSLVKVATPPSSELVPSQLVRVEDIKGENYVGKIMYVKDPRYIHVVASNNPGGEKLSNMAIRHNSLAAINGGGFFLADKQASMSGPEYENIDYIMEPLGIVMSEGKLVEGTNQPTNDIVGFTNRGVLISGRYTSEEMNKLGVREAVSFLPRLIVNGKRMITENDGGWGVGPRTAIAQKADGTVMFLVIDGRAIHSFGATLRDVQEELLARGAVNAVNLDGGSSSGMYYKGKLITTPSGIHGEKPLPNAFVVYNPEAEPDGVAAAMEQGKPRS